MVETIIVLVIVLIIVSLVLYVLERGPPIPGPLGPFIKWLIILAVVLVACAYLAQRFL